MSVGAIFDFDGTLVDSNQVKSEAFKTFARNIAPQSEEIMEGILAKPHGGRYDVWKRFFGAIDWRIAEDDLRQLTREFSDNLNQRVINCPEVYKASRCLTELRHNKVYIAINSATPLIDLKIVMKGRQWSHLVDDLFGGPATKTMNIKNILIKTGLHSENVVVFGDGEDDLLSAESIGCRFYAVGEARGVTLGQQTYTLHDACNHFLSTIL